MATLRGPEFHLHLTQALLSNHSQTQREKWALKYALGGTSPKHVKEWKHLELQQKHWTKIKKKIEDNEIERLENNAGWCSGTRSAAGGLWPMLAGPLDPISSRRLVSVDLNSWVLWTGKNIIQVNSGQITSAETMVKRNQFFTASCFRKTSLV